MQSMPILTRLLVMVFVLHASAMGQSILRGVVTDASNKQPLIGVNVVLQGTSLGASTDIEGTYRIAAIPQRVLVVRASSIGYVAAVREIDFSQEPTVQWNIALTPAVLEGEEVVVTAQLRGQTAAINQQLTSEAMINAVSAEKIQEIPDVNAAEAIGRLPGISLSRSGGEGSGVGIRGLSPKYSKITLNGVTLPSTNDINRATDLSMIAPENLAGIQVFKALTADMDADAISGTVNLSLAKARPEQLQTIRINGAYNAMVNDWNQYKGFLRTEGRYFEELLGVQATVNLEKRNRSADRLDASFLIGRADPVTGVLPIDINTASLQDRTETRKRWGAGLILDYIIDETKLILGNFYNKTDRSVDDRYHEYSNDRGTTRADVSRQSAAEAILTSMLRVESLVSGFETDGTIAYGHSKNQLPGFYQLVFEERTDLSKIDRQQHPADFLKSLPVDSAAELRESTMRSRITEESNLDLALNLSHPFKLDESVSGFVKFGGRYRTIKRSNDRTEGLWPSYLEQQKFYARDFLDPSYDPGDPLNGTTSLGLILDPNKIMGVYDAYQNRYIFDVFWNNNDRYRTDERIGAAYLMAKFNLGQIVSVTPGIRMETVNNAYTGYFRLQYGQTWPYHTGDYHDTTTVQKYTDWFPMVQMKVSPLEGLDLRFAVTRTLSRPDFWDLVPHMATSTNPDANITKGNPDLKPARSWNYDFYASVFSTTFGLFTAGVFYKDIQDVTIQVRKTITQEVADQYQLLPHIGAVVNMPLNVPESTIKGYELELQTYLKHAEFLPKVLRGIVVNANYTRLFSDTRLPYYNKWLVSLRPVRYASVDSLRPGRVPGQSSHIANLSVGYDLGGFSVRASLHYQTPSLSTVGVLEENDTYTNSFTRWDISLRQEVTSFLLAYLDFVNVTNNPDGAYQYAEEKPSLIEYYGTSVEFGIQFQF